MGCSKCGCKIPRCQDVHRENLGIILEKQDALDEAIDVIKMAASRDDGYAKAAQAWLDEWYDPTPWCHVCSASTSLECDCGPIAEND